MGPHLRLGSVGVDRPVPVGHDPGEATFITKGFVKHRNEVTVPCQKVSLEQDAESVAVEEDE